MPTPEAEVLSANEAFYAAFARRDVEAMESLWSSRIDLACVHPGWDALVGRREVLQSWRAILSSQARNGPRSSRSSHPSSDCATANRTC